MLLRRELKYTLILTFYGGGNSKVTVTPLD